MNYKIIVAIFFITTTSFSAQSKECDCKGNFKWLTETFEKNDAGYNYILEEKGEETYQNHKRNISSRIKSITSKEECVEIMRDYLLYFRKAHFSISGGSNTITQGSNNTENSWKRISLTRDHVMNSTSHNKNGMDGIWKVGAYEIGILNDGHQYNGVILESSNKSWSKNDLKLTVNKDGTGVYYLGDFSPYRFDKAELIGVNTLKLGDFYLSRIFPVLSDDPAIKLYTQEMQTENAFIHKLSKKTLLMRIPSFSGSQRMIIDSMLTFNKDLINKTDNLIIDLRNNGGGDDSSYSPLIPLLYTNPIRITTVEFLSTPLNNKRMEDYLLNPDLSEKSKRQINEQLILLKSNLGKFVNLNNGQTTVVQRLDKVTVHPKNVAIIVNDKNGSTAEQFLLSAKQSRKVKLFGVTTAGVLDISNMNFAESPDGEFTLGYCISKSYRLPNMPIDGRGIMPDYFIDSSIADSEWLSFVQKTIEN